MTIGIYKIQNKINGKVYIGQSQNVEFRCKEHREILRKNSHRNHKIQNAWNKDGEDNFTFELLEECTLEQLDEKEIFYIKKFNSYENGYNLTEGGGGVRGWHHSQEFKDMISLNNKTRPYSEKSRQRLIEYNKTRNYKHSEETKRKISESNKGKTYSEETHKRFHEGQLRAWKNDPERRKRASELFKNNNPTTRFTAEQKQIIAQKISIKNKGKKRSAETCEKIGNIHRGTKYMTNGKDNKRVREAEFQKYLDLGYRFGRSKYWCEIHDRKSM